MSFFSKKGNSERSKLEKLITEYPVYQPPHIQPIPRNSAADAQENFVYFLSCKEQRLHYLFELIKSLGFEATNGVEGITNVDRGIHKYGAYLVSNDRSAESESFFSFFPPWDGELRRLNVIWDLGIFVGDAICSLSPGASWRLCVGDDDPISRKLPRFHKPCVAGIDSDRPDLWLDPFQDMLLLARAKKELNDLGSHRPDFSGYMRPAAIHYYIDRWVGSKLSRR